MNGSDVRRRDRIIERDSPSFWSSFLGEMPAREGTTIDFEFRPRHVGGVMPVRLGV